MELVDKITKEFIDELKIRLEMDWKFLIYSPKLGNRNYVYFDGNQCFGIGENSFFVFNRKKETSTETTRDDLLEKTVFFIKCSQLYQSKLQNEKLDKLCSIILDGVEFSPSGEGTKEIANHFLSLQKN